MVNAKDAVKIAFDYFQSLPFHNRDKITDLELEEVELSEDSQYWYITLGYHYKPVSPGSRLAEVLGRPERSAELKSFKISADAGEVKWMKIRQIQ
jgi:hypothetical protein